MPRVVRTRTLRALRADADAVAALRTRMTRMFTRALDLQARAECAQFRLQAARVAAAHAALRAQQAEAERDAVHGDALLRAIQAVELTRDPERGEEIRGALALMLLRQAIAATKEHGDPEQLREIRIYDALLSEPETAAVADLQPGASAGGLEPQ
jgi:hypothetical protein